MQFFAKNAQEAHDMVIQAYKIAEQVNLPAMVNIDGFNLSHLYEPVEAATQEQVDSYLPEFKPKFKLSQIKFSFFNAFSGFSSKHVSPDFA